MCVCVCVCVCVRSMACLPSLNTHFREQIPLSIRT